MKAIIIEIKKDFCIAVTPDGSFVKQPIDQGDFELGDEISVLTQRKTFHESVWFKSLAAAAAVAIVIGLGSWGIFRLLGGTATDQTKTVALSEESPQAQEEMMMEAQEPFGSYEEEGLGESFALEIEQAEGFLSGPGEVGSVLELELSELEVPYQIIAGNIIFTYWYEESDQDIILKTMIEPLDPDLIFKGKITVSLLDSPGIVKQKSEYTLEGFKIGEILETSFILEAKKGLLNISLDGIFEQ